MICSVKFVVLPSAFLPSINMIENSLHINGMYDSVKAVRFKSLNLGFTSPYGLKSVRARHCTSQVEGVVCLS